MTIIVTSVAPKLIVMTVDEAVTRYFNDHRKYTTGRKAYCFHGVGCVATWGERVGHKLGTFLESHNITANSHSINDLRNLVWQYLTEEYQPRDYNLSDVGYHVAGFDQDNHPRLFEIVWGPKSRNPQNDEVREYQNYDSTPSPKTLRFSYGGRFGIAHTMVHLFFKEVNAGKDVRYDYSKPLGLVQFSDFVARFAGELTREVGPPFTSYLITARRDIEIIRNQAFHPLEQEQIMKSLIRLRLVSEV